MYTIKKIYKIVQETMLGKVVVYFLLFAFSIVYMDNYPMKKIYINCLNGFLSSMLLLTYYLFWKNRCYYKLPLIYIFSGIFVFNRLYDSKIIEKYWHYSVNVLILAYVGIVSIILILPEMIICLYKKWKNWKVNEKRNVVIIDNIPGKKENGHNDKATNLTKYNSEISDSKNENIKNTSVNIETYGTEKEQNTRNDLDKRSILLTISVIIIMIVTTFALYYFSIQGDISVILEKMNEENISKALISMVFFFIILLLTVTVFSIVHFAPFGGRKCVLERPLCGA